MSTRKSTNSSWLKEHPHQEFRNAPYLHLIVPNCDFEASVRIRGLSMHEHAACGLMAESSDGYSLSVNLIRLNGGSYVAVRSEKNGIDTANSCDHVRDGAEFNNLALRMKRMNGIFMVFCSGDGGHTWNALDWKGQGTPLPRPEMLAVRLGLWCSSFAEEGCMAVFDDFSVREIRKP
jgi:regulation of enolase protein 1 (concanavalin A-like superfamily)